MKKEKGLFVSVLVILILYIAPIFFLLVLEINEDILSLISYAISIPLILIAIKHGFGGQLNINKKVINIKKLRIVFAIGILLFLFNSGLEELIANFIKVEPTKNIDFYGIPDVIRIILLSPIIEELLFRGVFLSKLSKKVDIRLAIIIQATLFAIMHGADKFILIITSAILYGVIYVYYKSIIYPILLHIIGNTLVATVFWTNTVIRINDKIYYFTGIIALIGLVFIIRNIYIEESINVRFNLAKDLK